MSSLNDICVFDFETTGLDHVNDRVIEMAAIRVINGTVVATFSAFLQFDGVIPTKITEITGITSDMLVGGMDEKLAFTMLRRIMGPDTLLVAHNAAFDLQFLHHTMQRLSGKTFKNPFIDTMTIARDRSTYPHTLVDMCGKYGITLEGAHRALNDVEGCWNLLQAMHREEPVDRWINHLGYLKKYAAPAWVPEYATLFGTENKYEKRTVV